MVSGLIEDPELELVVSDEPRGLSCTGGLREEEEEDAVATIASASRPVYYDACLTFSLGARMGKKKRSLMPRAPRSQRDRKGMKEGGIERWGGQQASRQVGRGR